MAVSTCCMHEHGTRGATDKMVMIMVNLQGFLFNSQAYSNIQYTDLALIQGHATELKTLI